MRKLIVRSLSLALLTCAPAIAFAAGGGSERGHEGRAHHVFWRPPHHQNQQHNNQNQLNNLASAENFPTIYLFPFIYARPPHGDPQPCGANLRCPSKN